MKPMPVRSTHQHATVACPHCGAQIGFRCMHKDGVAFTDQSDNHVERRKMFKGTHPTQQQGKPTT